MRALALASCPMRLLRDIPGGRGLRGREIDADQLNGVGPRRLPGWDLPGVPVCRAFPEKSSNSFGPTACSKAGKSSSETPSPDPRSVGASDAVIPSPGDQSRVIYPNRRAEMCLWRMPLLGGVRADRDPLLPTVLPFVGDSPTELPSTGQIHLPSPGPSSDSAILRKIWYNHIEIQSEGHQILAV